MRKKYSSIKGGPEVEPRRKYDTENWLGGNCYVGCRVSKVFDLNSVSKFYIIFVTESSTSCLYKRKPPPSVKIGYYEDSIKMALQAAERPIRYGLASEWDRLAAYRNSHSQQRSYEHEDSLPKGINYLCKSITLIYLVFYCICNTSSDSFIRSYGQYPFNTYFKPETNK